MNINEAAITIPIEGKLYGDKKIRIYFQRKDWADFYELTDAQMQQAGRDIEKTFRHITANMGYGVSDPNGVGIRSTQDLSPEGQAYWADMIQRYDEWQKTITSKDKGICLDVCAFGFTYKEVAFQRSTSASTVMRHLRQGLGTYAYLQGWRNTVDG